jgi:hypothetical protein
MNVKGVAANENLVTLFRNQGEFHISHPRIVYLSCEFPIKERERRGVED